MQKNTKNNIWLNVASSTYVLDDFINLDNHIFLKVKPLLPILKLFFSKGHVQLANEYLKASSKAILLQHDCRKTLKFKDNSVDHILCSHFLEHVYLDEMKNILSDFYRVLKPAGTLHIIVPDLNKFIGDYQENHLKENPKAADEFIQSSILSKPSRGSLRYRLMEMLGGFGLQHRWMYDKASMAEYVSEAGFAINENLDVPSKTFREKDDSVHIKAIKSHIAVRPIIRSEQYSQT